MPVCTDDLDKAKAKSLEHSMVLEEISAELREGIVNYIQRRDIRAILPTG